jgi:hypothetical protein
MASPRPSYRMDALIRPVTTLGFGLLCLVSATLARAEPELRRGTIIIGVPRAQFVVLGADRLWSTALPSPGDPPSERRGRQVKIALHESLPLAVAAAGLATLGPERDTVEYIRQLIAPLDTSRLNFETIVKVLRTQLHDRLRAVRDPAKRALATKPTDAEAKIRLKVARLTLLVAYVAAGRATLGWLQLDDDWKAKRESPPHGAVAWPDSLDHFYTKGPFAGTAALFGYSIQEPAKLAEHVRRVIEAGIREDARLNQGRNRHVGGPVDVVLVDAKGARCVPSCAPP